MLSSLNKSNTSSSTATVATNITKQHSATATTTASPCNNSCNSSSNQQQIIINKTNNDLICPPSSYSNVGGSANSKHNKKMLEDKSNNNATLKMDGPNNRDHLESTSTDISPPHSNNSNNSSQGVSGSAMEGAGDLNSEKNATIKKKNKDEDTGSASNDKKGSCATTPTLGEQESAMPSLASNIKKEETDVPPKMSPVGFSTIGGNMPCSGTSSAENARASTPGKASEVGQQNNSNSKSEQSVSQQSDEIDMKTNNSNDTIALSSGTNNSQQQQLPLSTGQPNHNHNFNSNPNGGASVGGNSGGGGNNFVDYIQQQNHIFVFSTQLANKGAEAVLSGQFPTIIAYHYTQPATKNFLEDFFMKNPIKIAKLRQNNICNMSIPSGGGGQPAWISNGGGTTGGNNNSNNKTQSQQKGGKMSAENNKNQTNLRLNNMNSFNSDALVDGLNSDSDLAMCWNQVASQGTNIMDDTAAVDGNNGGKSLDDLASLSGSAAGATSGGVGIPAAPLESESCVVSGSGGIPSLQGVKVPDENLTPQQRQHREEQLAKLKKMNQFLFPENGGVPVQAAQASLEGGLSGLMTPTSATGGSASLGSVMCGTKLENMVMGGGQIGDDISNSGPSLDHAIGGGSGGNMHCNLNKGIQQQQQQQQNMPCGLMANSPELMQSGVGAFHGNEGLKNMNPPVSQDLGQISGLGSGNGMEWSKLQHQFFEERIKGGGGGMNMKGNQTPAVGGGGNARPNLSTNCPVSSASTSNQANRNIHGPPPPYHHTPRSASVPISAQSPNPASPNNNLNSNRSLPSPRTATSGVGSVSMGSGMPASSPNVEGHQGPLNSAMVGGVSGGEPLANAVASVNMMNRNRQNIGQYGGSNPSTPITHTSPKDIDGFNMNSSTVSGGGADLKTQRPSPQRSKTPLMTGANVTSNPNEADNRFPSPNPGFGNHHMAPANAMGNTSNFKSSGGGIERQFGGIRRNDNLPLNPHSNRPPATNKMQQPQFDPISSLAQMSQQLTSSVSMNSSLPGGGGGSPGGIVGAASNDPSHANLEGLMSSLDNVGTGGGGGSGMDACVASAGNVSAMGSMIGGNGVGGGFGAGGNNCHPMNPLNSMALGPRLINSKMCSGGPGGGFTGGSQTPAQFQNMLPPHRMMNRMPPMGFNNFNMSPNIQVKASTPNTIQYMPVRPQNNSMRLPPPSLDFLQRYANPGGGAGGGGGSGIGGPSAIEGVGPLGNQMNQNELNKIGGLAGGVGQGGPQNQGNSTVGGMNFYGNCQQMNPMALDTNEMGNSGDVGNVPSMRSGGVGIGVRQKYMSNHNLGGPRMPGQPNGPSMSSDLVAQFNSGNPADPMVECGGNVTDPAAGLYGGSGQGVNPLYGGGGAGPKQPLKGMGNVTHPQMGMIQNDPCTPGNIGLGGGNTQSSSLPPNVGNNNFVGPTSSDLKYAQQYHSFQQQLYATTTRGQQQQGGMLNSSNPGFFLNK